MSNPRDDEPRNEEPRPDEPRPAGSRPDEPRPEEPAPPEPPELKLELEVDSTPDIEEPPVPPPIEPPVEPTIGEPGNREELRPEPEHEPSQETHAEHEPEPAFPSAPIPPPEPLRPEPPSPESSSPESSVTEPEAHGEETPPVPPPEDLPADVPPATRRGVLARIVSVCAALPFLGGALVALRSGLSPVPEQIPERVPLGKLKEVPEQGLLRRAVTFPVRRGPRVEAVTEVVYLTRDAGKVIAFSARCTHQGCPVVTDKQVGENASAGGPPLVCPCHGGAFTATGEPAGGPVKERLPRLRLDLPDTPDGTILWVRVDG